MHSNGFDRPVSHRFFIEVASFMQAAWPRARLKGTLQRLSASGKCQLILLHQHHAYHIYIIITGYSSIALKDNFYA